jgi:hypothetical protein
MAKKAKEASTKPAKTFAEYFDDSDAQMQIAPLPHAWMKLSERFGCGDLIQLLEDDVVVVRREGVLTRVNLRGLNGIVVEVRNGRGEYPSRWIDSDMFTGWITESPGKLVVRFSVDRYGLESDGVTYKPRVLHAEGESTRWRKVK